MWCANLFNSRYINIFRGTLFISLFCVVSTPWNIIKNAAGLLAFLNGYSCLMGPLAGVMVTDYYIIKHAKLDINEMYRPHGIYWYSGGWNWRAWAAFCVGVAPLMPGFAKSIAPTLNVGGAWKYVLFIFLITAAANLLSLRIYTFAWIYGYVMTSLVYYGLNWLHPQTVSVIDVAVLPPQKGDVLPTTTEGSVVEDLKEPMVHEKRDTPSPV